MVFGVRVGGCTAVSRIPPKNPNFGLSHPSPLIGHPDGTFTAAPGLRQCALPGFQGFSPRHSPCRPTPSGPSPPPPWARSWAAAITRSVAWPGYPSAASRRWRPTTGNSCSSPTPGATWCAAKPTTCGTAWP